MGPVMKVEIQSLREKALGDFQQHSCAVRHGPVMFLPQKLQRLLMLCQAFPISEGSPPLRVMPSTSCAFFCGAAFRVSYTSPCAWSALLHDMAHALHSIRN